ncbi:MAG: GatB/YqeY domain-containing protein [Bacteroidales bacterium]
MSLIQNIDADIKKAMLAKEKDKLEALRAVKNAILLQRTEKGASEELDEQTELKILQKLVKQRKESAEIYHEKGRTEMAEQEMQQAEVIQQYLPEQMSEDQIKEKIKQIVDQTGASSMKDMGKVMGVASKQLAGKADNKIISQIVKEILS